jgi:hypothetical protein
MRKPKIVMGSPLARIIQSATGAQTNDVALIENIMRDEIFHSTLDWQTREQLADAARRAFVRLSCDRGLYESGRAAALAAFERMQGSSESVIS